MLNILCDKMLDMIVTLKLLMVKERLLKNKEIEFVVIREYKDTIGYRKNIPYLNDNYKEIKKFKQLYEGMDFTYYLYCLK